MVVAALSMVGPLAAELALLGGALFATPCDARAQGAGADQDPEDLARLRAELSRPGPEAQDVRFSAAQELLSRRDPRAHAVLHERLLRDEDPDGVRQLILERLEGRLRDDRDKVFGLAADTELEARLALHASYSRPLAHIMAQPVSAGDTAPRTLARACYLRLDAQARYTGIEAMLADPALRGLGISAARDSRLPRVGKLLAGVLADEVHGDAARRALGGLTFHAESFVDEAAFDAWYAANQGLTYTDLAERAAREAEAAIATQRAEHHRELRDARAQLATALCSAVEIRWDGLARLCGPDVPPEQVDACLGAIAPLLATRLHEGNGTRERRAFHRDLVQRLDNPVASERQRALLLEVSAYLLRPVDPAEKELRQGMSERLRRAMSTGSHELRLAALRGVRRFYSAENRTAVLDLVRNELASLKTGAEPAATVAEPKMALLTTAFATLETTTPRWYAPTEDSTELQALREALDQVIANPAFGDLRRQVIALARQRDEQGRRLMTLFRCLENHAREVEREPELRRLAFIYAQDYMGEVAVTDDYVKLALHLLADPESELRRLASERLKTLPETDERARHWSREILRIGRERLIAEPDPAVYRELVKILAQCAVPPRGDKAEFEAVLTALEGAIADTVREPVRPEVQFRLEPLFGELNVLAVGPSASIEHWIGAVQVFVDHKQRGRALDVLSRRRVALVPPDSPLARAAWMLPIRVAELRTPDEPLLEGEARDVREVMNLLTKHVPDWETPMARLLQVEVADALGEFSTARSIGDALLRAPETAAAVGDRGRVAVAEARARTDDASGAVDLLAAVPAGSSYADVAADLLEGITRERRTRDVGVSLRAADAMFALLRDDQPDFRDRFLLWAEVCAEHAPDRSEEVRAALTNRAGLFTAAECPEAARTRFDALLARWGGEREGGRPNPPGGTGGN